HQGHIAKLVGQLIVSQGAMEISCSEEMVSFGFRFVVYRVVDPFNSRIGIAYGPVSFPPEPPDPIVVGMVELRIRTDQKIHVLRGAGLVGSSFDRYLRKDNFGEYRRAIPGYLK